MAISIHNTAEYLSVARRTHPEPHKRLRVAQAGIDTFFNEDGNYYDVDVELITMVVHIASDTITGLLVIGEYTADDRVVAQYILDRGNEIFRSLNETHRYRSYLRGGLDTLCHKA